MVARTATRKLDIEVEDTAAALLTTQDGALMSATVTLGVDATPMPPQIDLDAFQADADAVIAQAAHYRAMAAHGLFFVILGASQWINGNAWGKYAFLIGLVPMWLVRPLLLPT